MRDHMRDHMSDVESQQQAKDAILALVDTIMYPPFGVEPGDAMMDGIDAVLDNQGTEQ